MRLGSWWFAVSFGLFFLGCAAHGPVAAPAGGTAAPPGPPATTELESGYGADAAPASGEEYAAGAQPAPTPASAAEATARAPDDDARARRPGLGTVWGEDRTSHVTTTAFYRTDPERPFATATLHYNDAAGVQAMAAQSGRSSYYDDVATPVAGGQLDVQVLDELLRPLPGTQAGGRTYVVGEAGRRYILRIQNRTGNRVEVVATVDGLDVIDGRPGSFRKRGYILAPWATLDIEGFRRSDSAVAAFRFGSVADSYAERKGKGRNVGVIGIAFFDEQGSRWPWTDEAIRYRHDADPFPGRYAEPPPTW